MKAAEQPSVIHQSSSHNTVGLRLSIIAIVPLVLVVVVGSVSFHLQTRPFIVKEYGSELDAALDLKQYFLSDWLDDHVTLTRYLSRVPAAREWDVDSMVSLGREFVATYDEFSAVVYVNPDGTVAADSAGTSNGYVGDREYFRTAMKGEETVSSVLIARSSGRELVIFAAPVHDRQDHIHGVVFAPIYLEKINMVVSELSTFHPIQTTLVDQNGVLIATNDPALDDRPGAELQLESGDLLSEIREGPDGRPVLSGRRVIEPAGWILRAEAPVDDMVRLFSEYNSSLLATVAASSVVLALLAFVVTQSITKPVNLLDEVSRRIAREDYATAIRMQLPMSSPIELKRLHSTIRDMAALVSNRQAELQKVSLTDPLTSLANRRHLEGEGKRIVTMCSYSRAPCSVLLLDIDHFKVVNDTFGHDVGDAVLVAFARAISRHFRAGDFIARYGGEEFVAMLPRTECPEARMIAERVRSSIAERGVGVSQLTWPLTVSVGVASVAVPDAGSDRNAERAALQEAITEADYYLYKAKNDGRNRVSGPC